MFFIYQGDWVLASVLFILANIGANGSFVFYDALLPHIARDDEVDRVSTAGYALGYLGGGLLLALNLAWIPEARVVRAAVGRGPDPGPATLPTRLAFLSVGVWWLVFSIPLFRRVPEPAAIGLPPDYRGQSLLPAPSRHRPVGRDRALARPISPGRSSCSSPS